MEFSKTNKTMAGRIPVRSGNRTDRARLARSETVTAAGRNGSVVATQTVFLKKYDILIGWLIWLAACGCC